MKFSAQEEHGLRCLLWIAKKYDINQGATIPEISEAEGLTQHTTAKILRELRLAGFLESERGHTGGYTLAVPPEKIIVGDVITALGGKLFDDEFCKSRGANNDICTHSIECSIKSLWHIIQDAVDGVVYKISLRDLMSDKGITSRPKYDFGKL